MKNKKAPYDWHIGIYLYTTYLVWFVYILPMGSDLILILALRTVHALSSTIGLPKSRDRPPLQH